MTAAFIWTPELTAELLRLRAIPGESGHEFLAEKMGVANSTVQRRLRELAVPPAPPKAAPGKEKYIAARQRGLSPKAAREEVGLRKSVASGIEYRAIKAGVVAAWGRIGGGRAASQPKPTALPRAPRREQRRYEPTHGGELLDVDPWGRHDLRDDLGSLFDTVERGDYDGG